MLANWVYAGSASYSSPGPSPFGSTKCTRSSKLVTLDANRVFESQCPGSSFQQALYRNVTEKTAQLEKRLENVIREGKSLDGVMLSLSALIDWLSERRDQPSHEQDVRWVLKVSGFDMKR